MGQIETKDSDHQTNDLSDRKGIIGTSGGSAPSSDLNIKIDDNCETKRESIDENSPKETQNDKRLKKAKTYDFACTVFYAMVAMLFFSTMSRTYIHYSGGSCGTLYGIQPLLAYTCVGLACAIIRSLRKHIKEEMKENSDDLDTDENSEDEAQVVVNGGQPCQPYHVSTLTSNEKLINYPNESKTTYPVYPDRNGLVVNIPIGKSAPDKSYSGLPLPILPPPNSLNKRRVSFQTPQEFTPLSVVDLKVVETDAEKEKNRINETHGSDPLIIEKDWKDIKFDTEMFRKRDSHQKVEYNWNDYNLNSIDKY